MKTGFAIHWCGEGRETQAMMAEPSGREGLSSLR